jgi:sugar (pentulose or hexulose) kinase
LIFIKNQLRYRYNLKRRIMIYQGGMSPGEEEVASGKETPQPLELSPDVPATIQVAIQAVDDASARLALGKLANGIGVANRRMRDSKKQSPKSLFGGGGIKNEQVSSTFADVFKAREIIERQYLSDPQVGAAYNAITGWEGQVQRETDRTVMS